MADPSFAQPARPNLLVPIAIALLVLAGIAFLLFRLLPRETAEVTVPRVAVSSSHLVFKSESMVVGADDTQDATYALVTVRISDHLKLPLFVKDFTANLTLADGSTLPVTSAVQKPDLPNLFISFPAVGKLAATQGVAPLYRETEIDPGKTAEGYVLLQFPITEQAWNERQSATLTIDLYHQAPQTVTIPKSAAAPSTPEPQTAPQTAAPPTASTARHRKPAGASPAPAPTR